MAEIRVADYFRARWQVFWATTFTFEPRDFEDFFLYRLGQPPLNAALLVDFSRLNSVYEVAARGGDSWSLRRVNRDYLVRGVHWATGAFHPKTYFFGDEKTGVLLVGSGNLGLGGIDGGKEVFVAFEADTPEGAAAIAAWRDWMQALVEDLSDPAVTRRWVDAMGRLPWIGDCRPEGSLFRTNATQSLIAQLADAVDFAVSEVHALAPFYDEAGHALTRVLEQTNPGHLHLYVADTMSVDGTALQSSLERWREVTTIYRLRGEDFIHAKLLGIVGSGTGLILSGSPNMSRAALFSKAASGNCEVAVLARASADEIRDCFSPPGVQVETGSWGDLEDLSFRSAAEGEPPQMRLLAATWMDGRKVALTLDGVPAEEALSVTDGVSHLELANYVTTTAWPADADPLLVWVLASDSGKTSNAVPIDDPRALARMLSVSDEPTQAVPGMDLNDLSTPIGEMLWQLHEACIFDFDQLGGATQGAGTAQEDETSGEVSAAFWERLQQEQLAMDRRTPAYLRWQLSGEYLDDEVFRLLRIMLDEAPLQHRLHLLGDAQANSGEPGSGHSWSVDAKLQVRLFNVLERWILGLRDPRLVLISDTAPARNYAALLVALKRCWQEPFLTPAAKPIRLFGLLLEGFFGKGNLEGAWERLEDERREELTLILRQSGAPAVAGGMAFAALSGSGPELIARVFEWQPFLRRGLAAELITPVGAATIASILTGVEVPETRVAEQLEWARTYIDDTHWASEIKRELNLARIEVTNEKMADQYGLTLAVHTDGVWLDDNRLVSLVRRAFDYRKVSGLSVGVTAPAASGRLSVHIDDRVFARVGSEIFSSADSVSLESIADLEASGAGWSALLRGSGVESVG